MITERDILNKIVEGKFVFPPLEFRLLQTQIRSSTTTCDALIKVSWQGFEANFAAEIRRYSSDKTIFEAVRQAFYVANQFDAHPLVIVPWLSTEQLESLERERISAIDLSGNGVVIIPGKILIFRSGSPNSFPDSRVIKNVYECRTSLVARALLLKPLYANASELLHQIQTRSGAIVQSTVSKALRQLEEDLIISRERGTIKLIQAEKLLDRLVANYERPHIFDVVSGKLDIKSNDTGTYICSLASKHPHTQLIVSGTSSVSRYAVMGREPVLEFYCEDGLHEIVDAISPRLDMMSRFPNIRILLVKDQTAFFDPRLHDGIRWASPLQSYLELMTGDKREKDTARQVRDYILKSIDWTEQQAVRK